METQPSWLITKIILECKKYFSFSDKFLKIFLLSILLKENHFMPKTESFVNWMTDNNLWMILGFLIERIDFSTALEGLM